MSPGGELTSTLWSALGGEDALERLSVSDAGPWLGGPLAVDALALGAVACALLAAGELARARGLPAPRVQLSGEHVALSFHSERNVLRAGAAAGAGFAPLSRFVRCADGGWARTHGNYPHHAAALARALAIEPDMRALEAAAARVGAIELEDAVIAAGGCAAAVRSREEWLAHPAGAAASRERLIAWEELGAGGARGALAPLLDGARPAAGVRVLDLTRVIAGPVAGRTLAALGAEVLRIDPPGLGEIEAQHLDSDPGKRSALLDLADARVRESLLAGADVLLAGYRPGSLARFSMSPAELAAGHPQLVQVWLGAWGWEGPWAQRRGFDSLVQAASGIARECAGGAEQPGALPAQALDHATGHLMAAAALRGLAGALAGERARVARVSLARCAAELLRAPRPAEQRPATPAPGAHRVSFGELSLIAPPGSLDGFPLCWAHGPRPFGADAPEWGPR